jgi:hypothetical protein
MAACVWRASCFGNPCYSLGTEYLTVNPCCDFGSDRITAHYHFHSDRLPQQLHLDVTTWDLHTSPSIHHAPQVLTMSSAGQTKRRSQLLWHLINWMLSASDARDRSHIYYRMHQNSVGLRPHCPPIVFRRRGCWGEHLVRWGWRKLHNEELHNLHCSPSIIRMMKSRRIRGAGHVARMWEKRNV